MSEHVAEVKNPNFRGNSKGQTARQRSAGLRLAHAAAELDELESINPDLEVIKVEEDVTDED